MDNLLEVEELVAGYGASVVLNGLSVIVRSGGSLCVLGRNGVGKTTFLNSIIGLTRRHSGTIRFAGKDITRLPAEQRARLGIGWVPQERNIFKSLTVEENLTAVSKPGPWSVSRIYGLFPRLAERRSNMGNQLSGGEQQMLAIGRALMLNPKLLLLDEPTEGLAPIIVQELLATLQTIMAGEGLSAVLVEQHAAKALAITDEAIVMRRGRIAFSATSANARADPASLEPFLGISDPDLAT